MKMSFRWYGKDDPVQIGYIRQIPNMHSIVSAVYDVKVGEVWSNESINEIKKMAEDVGLKFEVVESVPVHEDIKLGLKTRDKYIANYCENIKRLGKAGVKCICYNFMPVFDWTRTQLDKLAEDGSTSLVYYESQLKGKNPLSDDMNLPGWDSSYEKEELRELFNKYSKVDEEKLWSNLEYFLKAIIPVAKKAGVKMTIHPGSLGVAEKNDLVKMIDKYSKAKRIHFMHIRNIKFVEDGFEETSHNQSAGSLDIVGIVKVLHKNKFDGYVRPDHGRMIWGETGKPGYGLYDRALGANYINGIWDALEHKKG